MKYKLGDIAEITVGFPFLSSKFNQDDDGYRLIRGKNIGKGFLHWGNDAMCYSEIDAIDKKYIMRKNDVVLSMDGNVVKNKSTVKDNDLPSFLVQRVARLRAKEGFNQKFLWYLVNTREFEAYIDGVKTGTTIQHISQKQISDFTINIPSLETQKKIVRILSAFDNKIELNERINKNMYDFLKKIFKKQLCSSCGDEVLLESLIGGMAGGDWGKESLCGNNNTKVYCIRGADIPNMEYGNKGNAPERYILEKNCRNKKLEANDIIVEISGGSPTQSTGRTAYMTEQIIKMYDSPLLCTNFCKAIKVKNVKYAPLVYMFLKMKYDDGVFFSWENGTTGIKNLALNDIVKNMKLIIPDDQKVEKLYNLFNIIMSKIAFNSKQNQLLSAIRDNLLPKLMNDEIDLSNIY